ncbi:MAG: M14 family metallopeptidase [Vicinamibacteria bacterium]
MLLTTLVLALSLNAPRVLDANTQYDPKIPTIKQVLGYDHGDEITSPENIAIYLKSLAAAAPERTKIVEYAKSWEGRPLWIMVIGNADRMKNLDSIKAGLKKLADPRTTSAADREELVKSLPVSVWLMHGVHGNEISSSDAALAEAYHLLAAKNDAGVDAIMGNALVVIDPMENPDGRARFLFQNLQGRAAQPDSEPISAEHDEPWPGGRSNHYLFDMNRDWFALSQPETIGRVAVHQEYFPQVAVDLHEMGGNGSYYFAPPADPINPFVPKEQRAWFDTFGRNNGARFDEKGFAYFIREQYDSFYPGYGESWPIFNGAVGMTYEQASARALSWKRDDGLLLTFKDGVLHHFTAAIQTARTAAENREKLLRYYSNYRLSAIDEGKKGTQDYVLVPGIDPSRAERLARLLVRQGIDVRQSTEVGKVGIRTIPAGSYVVSAAQPTGRLIRNLLEVNVDQDEAFVKRQDERRKRRQGDQIYDVTAWSLPLAFGVECVPSALAFAAKTTPLAGVVTNAATALPAAKVAYMLPWGFNAAAAVAEALQAGLRVRVAGDVVKLNGSTFPTGTAIFRTSENADLAAKLGAIAAKHNVVPIGTDTSFVDVGGISLGSGDVANLKNPRVLLMWDAPTSSLSAGWARFALERRIGVQTTAVRVSSFRRANLTNYDVIVMPSADYSVLGDEGVKRIKDWVRAGGTVITIGEASRWAAKEKVALIDTRTENRDGSPEKDAAASDVDKKKFDASKPFDLDKAIQPERETPENTPGSYLRVMLDPDHWLSAGTDFEMGVLVESRRIFTPIQLDKGDNVALYAKKDKLRISGLVWDEAQTALSQKAYLIHQSSGSGHVIAFAEEPNYRAYTEGTMLLFANAVLLAPAF